MAHGTGDSTARRTARGNLSPQDAPCKATSSRSTKCYDGFEAIRRRALQPTAGSEFEVVPGLVGASADPSNCCWLGDGERLHRTNGKGARSIQHFENTASQSPNRSRCTEAEKEAQTSANRFQFVCCRGSSHISARTPSLIHSRYRAHDRPLLGRNV